MFNCNDYIQSFIYKRNHSKQSLRTIITKLITNIAYKELLGKSSQTILKYYYQKTNSKQFLLTVIRQLQTEFTSVYQRNQFIQTTLATLLVLFLKTVLKFTNRKIIQNNAYLLLQVNIYIFI